MVDLPTADGGSAPRALRALEEGEGALVRVEHHLLRDKPRSRAICLIDLPLTNRSRRIRPIVSTISIPHRPLARLKRAGCQIVALRLGAALCLAATAALSQRLADLPFLKGVNLPSAAFADHLEKSGKSGRHGRDYALFIPGDRLSERKASLSR